MDKFELKLDYYGALNLHKALLEAKFHTNPDNELVSGSPIVAGIYVQLRDYLIQSGKGWEEWLQLKNRPDYRQKAVIRMRKHHDWCKLTRQEKKKWAEYYLVPFLCSEKELEEVVDEVEGCSGEAVQ